MGHYRFMVGWRPSVPALLIFSNLWPVSVQQYCRLYLCRQVSLTIEIDSFSTKCICFLHLWRVLEISRAFILFFSSKMLLQKQVFFVVRVTKESFSTAVTFVIATLKVWFCIKTFVPGETYVKLSIASEANHVC